MQLEELSRVEMYSILQAHEQWDMKIWGGTLKTLFTFMTEKVLLAEMQAMTSHNQKSQIESRYLRLALGAALSLEISLTTAAPSSMKAPEVELEGSCTTKGLPPDMKIIHTN